MYITLYVSGIYMCIFLGYTCSMYTITVYKNKYFLHIKFLSILFIIFPLLPELCVQGRFSAIWNSVSFFKILEGGGNNFCFFSSNLLWDEVAISLCNIRCPQPILLLGEMDSLTVICSENYCIPRARNSRCLHAVWEGASKRNFPVARITDCNRS